MAQKKGYKHSEETKRKMSKSHKGKYLSEETRKKISQNHNYIEIGKKISETRKRLFKEGKLKSWCKGQTKESFPQLKSWIKGKTKETDERVKKLGENTSKTKKRLYKEGKIKIWNKGLTKENDERIRKYAKKIIGRKTSNETKEKLKNWKKQNVKGKTYEEIYGLEKAQNIKEKLGISHSGEKCHLWKGGIARLPYTSDFNDKFKRLIRQRDNQICMNCGIHREKLNKSLYVHHINYDKKLSIPQNCVSLCDKCHSLTNFSRTHWTKFFQSLLAERYGYQYSETGEIKINLNQELLNKK